MSLKEVALSLKRAVEESINNLPGDQAFRELVRQPLVEPGRALSRLEPRWSLLPLIICNGICGKYKHALPLAAAICFLQTAGDVFDDIEDLDSKHSLVSEYGYAEATNVATALLLLAQLALTKLKDADVDSESVVSIIAEANKYGIIACAGQHLDIQNISDHHISESKYLEIISLKSASQVECSCRTGAMLATKDKKAINAFGKFGHNLGIAAQIVNDIDGITKPEIGKSDIVEKKITLPVIYALENAEGNNRELLSSVYGNKINVTQKIEKAVKEALFDSGAIHYAVVTMELYRQKALRALEQAGSNGADTEPLTHLLESLKK